VAISLSVLLVSLFVCTVTDFCGEDKASDVKFFTVVHGRPGQGIFNFGELCSPISPLSDESANNPQLKFRVRRVSVITCVLISRDVWR